MFTPQVVGGHQAPQCPPPQRGSSPQTGALVFRGYDNGTNPYRESRKTQPSVWTEDLFIMESEVQGAWAEAGGGTEEYHIPKLPDLPKYRQANQIAERAVYGRCLSSDLMVLQLPSIMREEERLRKRKEVVNRSRVLAKKKVETPPPSKVDILIDRVLHLGQGNNGKTSNSFRKEPSPTLRTKSSVLDKSMLAQKPEHPQHTEDKPLGIGESKSVGAGAKRPPGVGGAPSLRSGRHRRGLKSQSAGGGLTMTGLKPPEEDHSKDLTVDQYREYRREFDECNLDSRLYGAVSMGTDVIFRDLLLTPDAIKASMEGLSLEIDFDKLMKLALPHIEPNHLESIRTKYIAAEKLRRKEAASYRDRYSLAKVRDVERCFAQVLRKYANRRTSLGGGNLSVDTKLPGITEEEYVAYVLSLSSGLIPEGEVRAAFRAQCVPSQRPDKRPVITIEEFAKLMNNGNNPNGTGTGAIADEGKPPPQTARF